ncbi:MAG: hypothetical protein M1822_006329 [Bathelium mastoideum]|nr:MAG: hypothetical protein M1822_006329 [Bathelium mastoideum]
MVIFLHEFVALSAADAYGRLTRKPQCVLVHVDVGTAALGQGLHNASSGKAPVLIFAGQAPFTLYGELAGSRSEHVHWYQDCPNPQSIVAPYSRYSNEIKSGEHVRLIVNRAILMASTGNPGPTYLTATREALAAPAPTETDVQKTRPSPSCHLGGLSPDAVRLIGNALLFAERPLVVTGYLGRSHCAVEGLQRLAELVGGLQVFDFEAREASFPANHRATLFRATGAAAAIKSADVILVIDADVPWIPTKVKPSDSATIYHIDIDPRKDRMMLFDIYTTGTYNAEAAIALDQLRHFITVSPALESRTFVFRKRWDALEKSHAEGLESIADRAKPSEDGLLTKDYLFASIRRLLPKDTIYATDSVTNQVPLIEQLQLQNPGTHLSKGGSGLGWAGGAAIGIKLATDMYDTSNRPDVVRRDNAPQPNSRFVCEVLGDGSFVFGVPSAVYWAQYRLQTPFLTVIINNGGWKATRGCIDDVHPNGIAAATTDDGLGIDLKYDGPDYGGIAKSAANGNLETWKVEKWEELEVILRKAVEVVKSGRGALIDAVIK